MTLLAKLVLTGISPTALQQPCLTSGYAHGERRGCCLLWTGASELIDGEYDLEMTETEINKIPVVSGLSCSIGTVAQARSETRIHCNVGIVVSWAQR